MRRFLNVIGTLLIIISVVFMLSFIVLPAILPSFDSLPPLKATFQMMFCRSGETLADSRTTYNPSPGTSVTSVNLSCVNQEHQVRDISSAAIPIGIVGYLVPFLAGLFILIANNNKKSASAVSSGIYRGAVDPELEALLKLEVAQAQERSGATGSKISDQLSNLAQLHKNGDLSDAEFESAKKKLLG